MLRTMRPLHYLAYIPLVCLGLSSLLACKTSPEVPTTAQPSSEPAPGFDEPQPDPSAAPAPAVAVAERDASEPEAEPKPTQASPYGLVWTTKVDGWNRAVDVPASGDPVFINSYKIYMLARHDGTVLESADVPCYVSHNGLHFVDENTGLIACDKSILEVTVPGLQIRRAHTVKGLDGFRNEIDGVDFQKDAIAYGTGTGNVGIISRKNGKYRTEVEFKVGGEVETIALSPDATKVVVGVGGHWGGGNKEDIPARIDVYDAHSGKLLSSSDDIGGRSRVTAMSYSPFGDHVFAHAGSFENGVWDVAQAQWLQTYHTGSWTSTSVWLRSDLVAAAGSDGVGLYPLDRGGSVQLEIPGVSYPTMEGIGASDDGSFFCSGERDGTLACWSNKPVEPSTHQAKAPLVSQ